MSSALPNGSPRPTPAQIDYRLDRLLEDWWRYESDYRGGPAGAKASSIYARSTSRSGYDSAYDVLGGDDDHVVMAAIGASVTSLPREHREAVEIRCLNCVTPSVWRSNRIPEERVEVLYAEAKVMLLPMLRRRRVEI